MELDPVLFSVFTKSRRYLLSTTESNAFIWIIQEATTRMKTLQHWKLSVDFIPESENTKKSTSDTLEIITLIEESKGTNSLKRPSNLKMLQPELSGTYAPNTA